MAGFGRQHEYRIGRALLVAFVLIVVGGAFFPVGILRLFGRPAPREEAERLVRADPWIRLIPADSGPPAPDQEQVPIEIIMVPDVSPGTDLSPRDEARRTWTFDPRTRYRTLSGITEPRAPAPPDSLILHAEFLNSMRLGNMGAALAMLDTSQAGEARRQFAATDRWVNRYLGPRWEAQGTAKRKTDLWWRAFGEADAEASH